MKWVVLELRRCWRAEEVSGFAIECAPGVCARSVRRAGREAEPGVVGVVSVFVGERALEDENFCALGVVLGFEGGVGGESL